MSENFIEEILLEANPVADVEQVRLPAAEMDARCASILERRNEMAAPTPTGHEYTGVRPPRRFRRPALAFAVGLLVALVAVGGVAVLVGSGEDSVVDEPVVATTASPTTVAPTTIPPTTAPAALDGRIDTLAYDDVPSFVGTVAYYQHDPASGSAGWQATIQVRHAGPLAFEATVLTESGDSFSLGGADTIFFGDGSDSWVLEGGSRGPFPLPFEPFRHLAFDGEHRASAWDDICGATPTELGVETIAGRTVTHVACPDEFASYELWIDEDIGLVLRMSGPLGVGDYSPYLARDGLFEFTEIVFEPVETPAPPEPAAAGSDLDVPPLHMISRESGEYWAEKETWYFDGRTLRETTIDAADASHVGSFTFAVDGQAGACFRGEGFCEVFELPDGEIYELFTRVPEELVADNCSGPTTDTVASRPANHYACDGIWFDYAEGWRASTDAEAGVSEFWYDTETGLRMKVVSENWVWEVTLLETNPQFPAGVFDYAQPDWVVVPIELDVGDVAPPWSGPLVDGGNFDMADQGGKYVVVYSWFPHYAATGLDFLAEFQLLSDVHSSESVAFVNVSGDILSETLPVLARLGITMPTVHCGYDPDQVCFPEEPWGLWGTGLSVVVIGPDRAAVAVFDDLPLDGELEALLMDIQ